VLAWPIWPHVYTLAIVMIGWVFFRAETLASAVDYLKAMAGAGAALPVPARLYLTSEMQLVIVAGLVLAMVPLSVRRLPALAGQAVVLALSLLYIAAGTYNPFIYFRF